MRNTEVTHRVEHYLVQRPGVHQASAGGWAAQEHQGLQEG